jgi:hypothetical protein
LKSFSTIPSPTAYRTVSGVNGPLVILDDVKVTKDERSNVLINYDGVVSSF